MPNSPTPHISDDELFEYIDQALHEENLDKFEIHLEVCQTCRERLAKYNALFSMIGRLVEEPLQHDLTPEVLTTIKKGAVLTPIWWWLLVIQGILALGLIVFAAPSIAINPFTFSLLESGRDLLISLVAYLRIWFQEWVTLIGKTSQLVTSRIPLSLGIPMQSIIWLLILSSVTWIAGNSILLRPQINRAER